ncbi:FtsB family cell division protein [Propionibacteriaceae bacterium Y1685]|uniref:FtsB family cell division protein n=1 Tax=Microlunatus sp. Y1700 TaxID=3418487 RepID=UPI003B816EDF
MPSGPKRTPRPGSGPGRGATARARGRTTRDRQSTGSSRETTSTAAAPAAAEVGSEQQRAAVLRRSGVTTRAIALGVVMLLLIISYASSLRVFFDQQRQLAEADQEIAVRQSRIDDLTAELERWKDPMYVKAQARERLGWAMPGETGYRVVGPDGKPIVPGAEIEGGEQAPTLEDDSAWYERLNGSVEAADAPRPAGAPESSPDPSAPPSTIAPEPSDSPSSSSTPR